MRRAPLFALLCVLAACGPKYADLPLTPTQTIAQSEDALRRGEYATAANGFSDYLASGQQSFRARAYYELAQAQYGLENYEAALATIADLEAEYPKERWAQPETLRGDIMYALGKRVDAIDAWQRAWLDGTDADRAFLRSRIQETGYQLSISERDQLADTLTQPDVRTILALGTPNELGAPPLAPPVVAAETTHADRKQAEQESEADTEAGYQALEAEPLPLDDRAAGDALAAGSRVACLLPLTGPNRETGQQALNGLRQAFAGDASTLLVRDTGGDPDLAARLANALAADVTVLAIIGPVQDSTAAAVAPVAERAQMPTVLLTSGGGLAGSYVLQTGTASSNGSKGLAYDAGVLVRDAIANGARSRGALLTALRKQTQSGGGDGALATGAP
ncbi:MAG TPA: ABC transporter substrate-binding protein [Candidatus Dormibacteraeota bacterium]|nr:ABC transporter substrate-binding protein [Candidatus Dormibacteraeota bacterium]